MSDIQALDWEGHAWSDWYQLDESIRAYSAIAPNEEGIYRIRCRGDEALIYIGETGASIRGRFRQLRKAAQYVSAGKPPGPPHVAGGCVYAHEQRGEVIEVSWFTTRGIDPAIGSGWSATSSQRTGRQRVGIRPASLLASWRHRRDPHEATRLDWTAQSAGSFEIHRTEQS